MAVCTLTWVKLKPDASVEEGRKIWDESVIPATKDEKGLISSFLLVSEQQDEAMSVALWESKEAAEAIQKSGLYQEQLKKFLSLIKSVEDRKFYDVNSEIVFMRELEAKVASMTFTKTKPDISLEEVREVWDGSVVPAMKSQKGLVCLFLLASEQRDEGISFGLWESKEDSLAIQKSGLYREQIKKFSAFIDSVESRKFYNVNSEILFVKELEAV